MGGSSRAGAGGMGGVASGPMTGGVGGTTAGGSGGEGGKTAGAGGTVNQGAGAGGTGGTAAVGGGLSGCDTLQNGTRLTCLDLEASALCADPSRGLLYAVAMGGAAKHANELVVIDPEDGSVQASVFVGSDPDSLALSDDGSTLWVGLHGALALRQVDMTKSPPEPGAQYAAPWSENNVFYAVHAGAMVTIPGARESVAIALQYDGLSPSGAGVALLDSGIPRGKRVERGPSLSVLTGGPPGHLLGFDDQYQVVVMTVDESGLSDTRYPALLKGPNFELTYADGFLFGTHGQVLDVSSPEEPKLAGTFAANGLVVPHVASSHAVVLSSTYEPEDEGVNENGAAASIVIHRFDLSTFAEESAVPLDGRFLYARHFVEPAPGLFAFIDFHIPGYGTWEPVRSAVVLVSVPEFAEPAR